jgi:hypothetical protein
MTEREKELEEALDASMKANVLLWDKCERLKRVLQHLWGKSGDIIVEVGEIEDRNRVEVEREEFRKLMEDNGFGE